MEGVPRPCNGGRTMDGPIDMRKRSQRLRRRPAAKSSATTAFAAAAVLCVAYSSTRRHDGCHALSAIRTPLQVSASEGYPCVTTQGIVRERNRASVEMLAGFAVNSGYRTRVSLIMSIGAAVQVQQVGKHRTTVTSTVTCRA